MGSAGLLIRPFAGLPSADVESESEKTHGLPVLLCRLFHPHHGISAHVPPVEHVLFPHIVLFTTHTVQATRIKIGESSYVAAIVYSVDNKEQQQRQRVIRRAQLQRANATLGRGRTFPLYIFPRGGQKCQ